MEMSQDENTNNKEIFNKLIERTKYIKVIGKNEIFHHNINKTDLLHELGNTIYKLVSACWLYDRYNKKDISLYRIECIISLYKTGIKDEMYNAWLKNYIDSGKTMKYFDKKLYNNNVYVLIGIVYINYGFCYTYEKIYEFIKDKYADFFEKISDKYLNSIERDKNEINRANKIAEILSITENICSYEKLCEATSFNSLNNTASDSFLTYLGIYVFELLAFEHIVEHCENIDIDELKIKKAILLNAIQIDRNLPDSLYDYLKKDDEAIEKDFRSRVLVDDTTIFKPYYNVTAIKNVVAIIFHKYVLSEKVNLLHLCKYIFDKFSNTVLSVDDRNVIINGRMFLYYFCKINDFDYKEEIIKRNVGRFREPQKGHRVTVKLNHVNEGIEQEGKKIGKVYKKLFRELYKNVNISISLLNDEILAYLNNQSSNKKVKSKPVEVHLNNNVNFNNGEHVLYIVRKTSNCINRNHKVRAVTGILKNLRGREVKLNVNYCENCMKFSINYMDFDRYCKNYGIILGNFSFKYMNFERTQDNKYKLAKESILHFCGYNVNKEIGLTENERHLILMNIMDHGIMKKPEIMEYLHFYINNIGNRSNMKLAVSKWEDDLCFVNNYKIDMQRHYKLDKVRHR